MIKVFQKLAQIMKLKENKEKSHIQVSNPNNKNSVCMKRNSSTPIPLGHIAVDIRSVISKLDKLVA